MFFQHIWWWVEVHTGTTNEPGPYYGFWSGFGSDIGEVVLIGAIYAGLRKVNCHVKGCFRIGHYEVKGTPYKVCRKHHPSVPSEGATETMIHDAFHKANR